MSLWPAKRQAEALDRVGDEADRPVVIDAIERLDDRRQVVAAEIVHQPRQLVVAARVSISRVTSPWSPISSRSRLRQAAPP